MATHYHHGDLRNALLDAAAALLQEQGLEGFSLRETARRAGVSAAAPKHHFKDARALLTALACTNFDRLAVALEQADLASDGRRAGRIRAQGRAYVAYALQYPAGFDLMWRAALLDLQDPALLAAKERAFAVIDRVAAVSHSETHAATAKDPATMLCWSSVHGLARLALDGALGPPGSDASTVIDDLLPPMLDRLVTAVAPSGT